MPKDERRISRREFEKAALVTLGAGLAGSAVAGCHEYRPACATDAIADDTLDGYVPRFLTRKQCVTLAATAEVMIASCPPVISAAEVARRADQLLANTEAPSAKSMAEGLDTIENFAGLLSFQFESFSELELKDREEVIKRFVKEHGEQRDASRVLKMLTVVPYYSHPEVRRSLGFVDFERREHYNPLPTYSAPRVHPEPETFGPPSEAQSAAAAGGADERV